MKGRGFCFVVPKGRVLRVEEGGEEVLFSAVWCRYTMGVWFWSHDRHSLSVSRVDSGGIGSIQRRVEGRSVRKSGRRTFRFHFMLGLASSCASGIVSSKLC